MRALPRPIAVLVSALVAAGAMTGFGAVLVRLGEPAVTAPTDPTVETFAPPPADAVRAVPAVAAPTREADDERDAADRRVITALRLGEDAHRRDRSRDSEAPRDHDQDGDHDGDREEDD